MYSFLEALADSIAKLLCVHIVNLFSRCVAVCVKMSGLREQRLVPCYCNVHGGTRIPVKERESCKNVGSLSD